MSAPSTVLSQTLQQITTTKIRELGKQRKVFETRKKNILEAADAAKDERSRLRTLLSGFDNLPESKKHSSDLMAYQDGSTDPVLQNIRSYLSQSEYDPTVSLSMLQEFENTLRLKLSQYSRRYDFADLYSQLLIEWSNPSADVIAEASETGSLDGSFELVERDRLQQLRDKFTKVVFTPRHTDEVAIDNYLSSLFEGDHAEQALEKLRSSIRAFGDSLTARRAPFNTQVLKLCIDGLLKNDLMNEEPKSTLTEFLTNDLVLNEIADVLNMRFSDLENWSWEADDGMYYEPRRQINGKYRIMMDEDILQAIFLHYIGVTWAVKFKDTFRAVVADQKFWKGLPQMRREEQCRYHYYYGAELTPEDCNGVDAEKRQAYGDDYFMASMPGSIEEAAGAYDDDDEDDDSSKKSRLEIRQQLLRQLATEVIIRRSLYGDVAVVQSDLQWFATGLPHSTIFALLRFWGIPENWVAFFKKFAEAPLRMSDAPGAEVRIRKRGIPITDAFEKLLGELVLFAMDVAVNQESGMTLYRLHDDLWLCGEPTTCAKAWKSMERFVEVLGLDINFTKTGSVYLTNDSPDLEITEALPKGPVSVGLLTLSPAGQWTIDQIQAAAHVKQFKKQLAACTSIFAWVQTWNSCIGRFFGQTFGEPANCFGQDHVNTILQTHEKMQRELFDETFGGSVTAYLRGLIAERIGVADVPDSFFFLPESLGGLGLRNPFIGFLVIRDQLYKDPKQRMLEFKEEEAKAYKASKEAFAALSAHDRRRRFKKAYDEDARTSSIAEQLEKEEFMAFEECMRHREVYSPLLRSAYLDLMSLPQKRDVMITQNVNNAFRQPLMFHSDSERKWILQLYSADLFEQFGELSIVDQSLLPLGVMESLRKKKVTWEMVL